jgi:hypothetical protein
VEKVLKIFVHVNPLKTKFVSKLFKGGISIVKNVAIHSIKAIPILGIPVSIYFMAKYIMTGNWNQAAIELLSMIPGPVGWTACVTNLAIDAKNLYIDDDKEDEITFTYKNQLIKNPSAFTNTKSWE